MLTLVPQTINEYSGECFAPKIVEMRDLLAILLLGLAQLNSFKAEYTNCLLTNGNNAYDLRPLAEKTYRIDSKSRFTGGSTTFFLSFCHPLKSAPEFCSDPDSSVCIEQTTDDF